MALSTPIFVIGLAIAVIGTVMLLLSFRPRGKRERIDTGGVGVIFIGPIPFVIGGRGRWTIVWMIVAAVIILLFLALSMRPDLIGW